MVEDYNKDPNVHGILVQLPLPKHINEKRILDAISLEKDVDGFHPQNIGCLGMRGREPLFVPCTPMVSSRGLRRACVGEWAGRGRRGQGGEEWGAAMPGHEGA